MLKITNDGRKLALDQRLINELLPDHEDSKVNACINKIFEHWEAGKEQRLTQLAFCDLSTPKADTFNVYHDARDKLLARGVPADEIAFIHDANTDQRKKELFAKVRQGKVRILFGSTAKMGAGTNVQDLIIASHDLDAPWRPRDLTQRGGRTIRQGNKNPEVHIYRYVTENTFDSYMWQLLENKQKFIAQVMTGKSPVRSCEDVDDTALSYAEVKALATGNPHIKEKMEMDIAVSRLKMLEASYNSQIYALEDSIARHFPQRIALLQERIAGYTADVAVYEKHKPTEEEKFVGMTVKGIKYTEKADAGMAVIEACKGMTSGEPQALGEYMGFSMSLSFDEFYKKFKVTLQGELSHTVDLGTDIHGNITRLNNELAGMAAELTICAEQLATTEKQLETAKEEVKVPFNKADELKEKSERLAELNALLNMDEKTPEVLDEPEAPPQETALQKKQRELELEHSR